MLEVRQVKMGGKLYNKAILARQQNIKSLYFKKMLKLIETNDKVCFLASDALMEGSILRRAMSMYPNRIIDVGIAEQNLVGVAAGMAISGMLPYVNAMAPFLIMRALEQIHTDIAYNDVPVKLIGASGGTSNSGGPTHHLICDFGIMNAIPNMTIVVPSNMNQFLAVIESTIEYPFPIYIRMPTQNTTIDSNDQEISIGKARVVHKGNDVTIIATGRCVKEATIAATRLSEECIFVRVVDMHTIKPIDKECIITAAKETENIIIAEDHNAEGGLGTLVCSAIAESGIKCKIRKLGIPDEFALLGNAKQVADYYGFSANGMIDAIHSILM